MVALVIGIVAIGTAPHRKVITPGGDPGGGPSPIARSPIARSPSAGPSPIASTTPSAAAADATASPTPPAPQPPYAVQDASISLEDPSRDTPARGDVPGHAGRLLTTIVRRPVGVPGPLPLVVFAHGWNSNPAVYATLLDTWAAAGYLVAAPIFPDSANTLPGTPVSNYPEQARDISFVITSLLAGQAGPVDPTRIAVAGHSDGGTDVALMALNPAYADLRVRAYLSLSSEIPSGVAGPWGTPTTGALLVAVGTRDEYGLLPQSTQVFDTARVTAKVLLTVAGGDHLEIFVDSSPEAVAVREETVRFLNVALGVRSVTSAALATALDPPGNPAIAVTAGPAG
jgi:fermentation-respiration switch protein FrsA (DUF1100 family)